MFYRSQYTEKQQAGYLRQLTWRACREVKKRAMDQEFTWNGLVFSLSIAFFVVFGASSALNSLYEHSNFAETKLSASLYALQSRL